MHFSFGFPIINYKVVRNWSLPIFQITAGAAVLSSVWGSDHETRRRMLGGCTSMIGAAAGSSPPLGQCQWWNVLYGFNISFRAVELHTWQFLHHHVNALCTNWFFIWWNGMEGLHISKYAVNDASTINDEPPALTNKISMANNQKHMYWHVNLGLSMLILWLCSYCASTWRRLAAARRLHGRCGYPLT